ncbi:hypothetical protein DL96DRAFT_1624268 [Flagelloscypha sp. PMI_526]|nr:hypothetical protein DL96DRAFT_1624268 [Flagelloscypha sp. PMI_526]
MSTSSLSTHNDTFVSPPTDPQAFRELLAKEKDTAASLANCEVLQLEAGEQSGVAKMDSNVVHSQPVSPTFDVNDTNRAKVIIESIALFRARTRPSIARSGSTTVLSGRVEKPKSNSPPSTSTIRTHPRRSTRLIPSQSLNPSSPQFTILSTPPQKPDLYSCGCATPDTCCRCTVIRLCQDFCFQVDDFEYRYYSRKGISQQELPRPAC